MENSQNVIKALNNFANKEKTKILMRFFKTGEGQYGYGDKFLGIIVPIQREVAKKFKEISLSELEKLLKSTYHEHRLTALLILTYKFPKSSETEKEKIISLYLKNTKYINNWDLVDLSAPKILGEYLLKNPQKIKIIYALSHSKNLWEKRISILSTYTFIKAGQFSHTLKICKTLLLDDHDLIRKAVGWMLREIGKIDQPVEEIFLKTHCKSMPRTALRYAIERFSDKDKKIYMNK
ncbi:MAG: DNA alkylation repair protein [Candidatus Gracilibacteria bacterium]|jgi:3-methyladenine DNA glycosylase AlkD